MKKIWNVVGLVVLIGAVVLINRTGAPLPEELTVANDEHVEKTVEMVSEDLKPSAQSLDDASVKKVPPAGHKLVSDAVLSITGKDADYKTRLNAMRELGYEISLQDVAALMDFFAVPMPEDSKLRPRSFNSIRNDALELLLRQKNMPEGMGDLLTSVYSNPDHDDMWRNYCIQFMEPFYERFAAESVGQGVESDRGGMSSSASMGNGDVAPPKELQSIQNTLWDALGERDNSNAGTALLALDKLSRNHAEFDQEQINAAMIDLAADDSASLANRVTALRLCGEQGNVQALDTARNLARNSATTMIRCAAIATLGDLGAEEDRIQLETYATSDNKRIQSIAQHSLEKLSGVH